VTETNSSSSPVVAGSSNGTDVEICVIEWVAVYGFAIYFYTFSFDWKDYAYVLALDTSTLKYKPYDQICPIVGQPVFEMTQAQNTQPLVVGAVVYPQHTESVVLG
jgi:hypothetical protein